MKSFPLPNTICCWCFLFVCLFFVLRLNSSQLFCIYFIKWAYTMYYSVSSSSMDRQTIHPTIQNKILTTETLLKKKKKNKNRKHTHTHDTFFFSILGVQTRIKNRKEKCISMYLFFFFLTGKLWCYESPNRLENSCHISAKRTYIEIPYIERSLSHARAVHSTKKVGQQKLVLKSRNTAAHTLSPFQLHIPKGAPHPSPTLRSVIVFQRTWD